MTKLDDVTPTDLIKEISAFSNTYGGYIFLGVADDKTVMGCKKWTEQRITTTIHSCLTPTPNFDIKKFNLNNAIIYIIKIEIGDMPPYITNKGGIYERISSSSCKIVSDKITDAIKLHQLFDKAELQKRKIEDKLYIEPLANDNNLPNNLCAYIDFGFDVTNSRKTKLQQNWADFNFAPVSNYLKDNCKNFSISRIGKSFLISLGNADTRKNNIPIRPMAGMHNFIEIMTDGNIDFARNCAPKVLPY